LDEDTPSIREFHDSSLIASEQVESVFSFKVGNLFGEGRLGDVQSVCGPREVPLFRQDNDRVQVADFEVGEHCSNPRRLRTRASCHEAVHILIDFRTVVIVFLFAGPDSGQQ
jgi:hypothetical protein